MSMLCFSSSTVIRSPRRRQRVDYELRGSEFHKTISTRSPASSDVTACTREPSHADARADGVNALVIGMTPLFSRASPDPVLQP